MNANHPLAMLGRRAERDQLLDRNQRLGDDLDQAAAGAVRVGPTPRPGRVGQFQSGRNTRRSQLPKHVVAATDAVAGSWPNAAAWAESRELLLFGACYGRLSRIPCGSVVHPVTEGEESPCRFCR